MYIVDVKMAELTTILKKIKTGEIEGLLQDVKTFVSLCTGTVETQQLIRHCSRYVYEQPNITQSLFSQLVEIVIVCCKHQQQKPVLDASFHVKSMYYIILMATKRKDLHQYLPVVLSDIHHYTNLCDAANGDMHTIVKNLYQSVWNASLVIKSSLQALTLQQHALLFFLASGANITKVCDQAMKILFNFEHVNKSLDHTQDFCLALISQVIKDLKEKGSFGVEEVLATINFVLLYGKTLLFSGKCAEFSKTTQSLVSNLDTGCDEQTIMALKVGLKLSEVGMAFRIGKCKEAMLVKFIQSCSMAPSTPFSNNIILLCLLCLPELFEAQLKKESTHSLNPQVLDLIVENILGRCSNQISEEISKKIAAVLSQQLGGYIEMLKRHTDQNYVLQQALPWMMKTRSFINTYCSGKSEAMCQIYNVGVNAGNLGVLAFRANSYELAAKFLETTVEMLSMYFALVPDDQKSNAASSLHKKLVLWSDALRYSGSHWEAAVAACGGMLMGFLSVEEMVTIWVKCKRDAEKAANKKLRGLTICDVVREAQTKYKEAPDVKFDNFAVLKCEVVNYKKQNHDTAEDQLSCGRALLDYAVDVEGKIFGLLVVAETLWTQPSLISQNDEAVQTVKKAITLVVESKSKGSYSTKLQELEALAYFWLYLCHLQQIQDTATAEVQESEKPTSLTAQATDLGEEVQVDDSCDVRPSLTCLTLYAQETSLASLHIALSLWEDLNSKGVSLEDTSVCLSSLLSTGYVYQLSGIVNPTIRTWATLVSLARRHSDTTYFIKGVTELLLVAPELVPQELVKEAEEKIAVCQDDKSPESSVLYMCLGLTAAIAYYFLKNGQYKEGGRYLKQALNNELMEKRTIRATEIQAIIHYVASLYAWLPSWVLENEDKPSQPSIVSAMLACRQAMAVLKSSGSSSKEVLCWRHRVGWLHITTTLWLGHVCLATAQPRLARAYLRQSLGLTQELALPLRTGELLELLARVDLLCDQLDDCLVKVDSLMGLLVTHPSDPDNFTPAIKKQDPIIVSPINPKEGNDSSVFRMFANMKISEEESMRACSNSFEYDLNAVNINPGLLVVGPPERVNQLATLQAPPSPSLGYREKVTLVQVEPCPHGYVKCIVCSTPTLHRLRMSAMILLAYSHAHKGHFFAAQKSLDMFKDMYTVVCESTPVICSHLISVMVMKWKKKSESLSSYILSKLNLVYLQSLHCQAEILALEECFEKALESSMEALKNIQSIDTQILLQGTNFVTVLILQMYSLQRARNKIKKEEKQYDEVKLCDEEDKVPVLPCKTPSRFCKRMNKKTDNNTSYRIPKITRAPVKGKGFDFSSSDDDDSDDDKLLKNCLKVLPSEFSKKSSRASRKQTVKSSVKFTDTDPSKQHLSFCTVDDQYGKLNTDTSPGQSVFKVPNTSSVSPHVSAVKSCTRGVENIQYDSSYGTRDVSSSREPIIRPCTEKKTRGIRKVVSSVPIYSDKDSPDCDVTSNIEFDISEKRQLKSTGTRPKKTSEEKNGSDKNKSTTSRAKGLADTDTRPKTRSRRTIR